MPCPFAEFITDDLMEVINSASVPYERLQPGQIVWLGVPAELARNQIGKALRELPLKPIVLTILTEQDVLDLIAARERGDLRVLRRRRVARLFREAKVQGAVLPYSDLAALFAPGPFAEMSTSGKPSTGRNCTIVVECTT
jgi:hypothetical protein